MLFSLNLIIGILSLKPHFSAVSLALRGHVFTVKNKRYNVLIIKLFEKNNSDLSINIYGLNKEKKTIKYNKTLDEK